MGYENSGRRPEPTALTVLRGNPSRKKLNVNEAVPPHGPVTKPVWLSEGGGTVWDRIAPVCEAMGTLTTADVETFASLCELQWSFQQTAASKDGRQLFRLERDGKEDDAPMKIVVDGVLRVERETATALRPYYDYFGMTPSSRARISVPKPKDQPESKWAGALK